MTAAASLSTGGQFDPELGIWFWTTAGSRLAGSAPRIRPALFLDRDGVIVEDPGYLARASDVTLLPGAADVIAQANGLGIPVIEVTNQSGIARGYLGWQEFVEVEEALAGQLAAQGAALDGVFACPYHANGLPPWQHPAHPARKPQPGMLLEAARRLSLDLGKSWIIGDKLDDLEAGFHAGLRGGLHVLTGHGAAHRPNVVQWQPQGYNVRLVDSIADAAALLSELE